MGVTLPQFEFEFELKLRTWYLVLILHGSDLEFELKLRTWYLVLILHGSDPTSVRIRIRIET